MNYKKIMSAALSATMILSSVGVLATEESVPACAMTELSELDVKAIPAYYAFDKKLDDEYAEDIKLDFGVKFEATEDEATEEFANYVVDFELSFDQDVTAILAGQYDLFDDNWISVKADSYTEDFIAGLSADVDGIDFKADEPMMIMHDSGLDDQFTYEEAVAIKSFNCGIKYAYDAPEGVKATLDLCVYPTKEVTADEDYDFVKNGVFYSILRDEKIVVDSLVYEYEKKFAFPTVDDCIISVIPTDEAVMAVPAYEALEGNNSDEFAEELNLDYAVKFEATAEDAGVYANHIVDIELSFDKDVTAILAGQYDLFSNNWVSVKAKEYTENVIAGLNADVDGIEFKANKPVMVMFDSGLDDQFTYEEAVAIKSFNCGIKYAYNVPNGVKATVKLCVYPSVRVTSSDDYDFVKNGEFYAILRDEKEVVKELEYTYKNSNFEETTTEEEIVDFMNKNVDSIVDVADAAGAVDLIESLSPEAVKEIDPEVIKAIVDATGADTNVEDTTVFGLDSSVNVTAEEAEEKEAAFANIAEVYEVTAVDSVTGPVTEVEVPVLVAIPVVNVAAVKQVLHIHNGDVVELPFFAEVTNSPVNGAGIIYVQMSQFSQIALVVDPSVSAQPGSATLKFVETSNEKGEAKFDLILSGGSTADINGFLAGEFVLSTSGASCNYTLTPANDELDITFEQLENGRKYLVNLKSFVKEGTSKSFTVLDDGVTEIKLGELAVTACGTGVVNFSNVALYKFDYANSAQNLKVAIGNLSLLDAVFNIAVPTQELKIEIDFVHPTNTDNAVAYQDMSVTITGADINETIELGNNNGYVTRENNKYIVKKTVLANREYFVTVEGAGYRTANYSVKMGEEDRTIKFWNNYKDEAIEMVAGDNVKVNANFLAGDIVKDNIINIYDLSAVVSYFGETGLVGVNDRYAKYDLNRDGNIDSMDVAILLTSWGK